MNSSRLKQLIAGLLAGAMIATTPGVAALAEAAGNYYIHFDSVDDATTTIIQGDRVNAKASIPPGHEFDIDNPFVIRIKDAAANAGLLTVTRNSRNYYTFTASPTAAYGNAVSQGPNQRAATTYTLDAKLTATLTEGGGSVWRPADDEDPASATTYSLNAASKTGGLAITTDSLFSFEATSNEVDGNIAFGKVTAAQGNLQDLENEQVMLTSYTKKGNTHVITIKIGLNDKHTYELSVTMPPNTRIIKGTRFTVSFGLQYINPLILTVVTPKWAVDEVARSITDNPTNPNVTDSSKIPYINLSTGDTLSNISKNFTVLSKMEKFNSEVHIDWRWESTGYPDVVEFLPDGGKTRGVLLNPRKEDVKGMLVAKVDYTLKEAYQGIGQVFSEEIKIPITVLGTGDPPELRPLTEVVGNTTINIDYLPTVMDVYDNSVPGYTETLLPNQFTASLTLGQGRGRAEKTVITASGITPNAVSLYIENSPVAYEFGSELVNTDPTGGKIKIDFVAKTEGQVTLTFDFYVRNSKNQLVKSDRPIKLTLVIKNTTPRDFANIETVVLQSEQVKDEYPPRGEIDFGFKPDKYLYTIELPHKVTHINLTPILFDNKGTNDLVGFEISGEPKPVPPSGFINAKNRESLPAIEMPVNLTRTVTLTVTAENGRKQLYIFSITRLPPDRDSSLKSLSVTDRQKTELLTNFSSKTLEYQISVPYKTDSVSIQAIANSLWSKSITFDPPLGAQNSVQLQYDAQGGNNTTVQRVIVQAEDENPLFRTTYTVHITRRDPSDNNLLSTLAVKTKQGQALVFTDGQVFKKDDKYYALNIPYSATELEFSVLPDALEAERVTLRGPGSEEIEKEYNKKEQPITFGLNVDVRTRPESEFIVTFAVTAENGQSTNPPYELLITRSPPDEDNTLLNLELRDQNDKLVDTFSFNPETMSYKVPVPYETEQVKITPTTRSPLARVEINGKPLAVQRPYHMLPLKPGETGSVKVEIYPEDVNAQPRVYELSVTRSMPATDARLKSLVVTGTTGLDPSFVPSKTQYRVTMPTASAGITIVAEPNHPSATMTINGKRAQSGVATEPIVPLDAKSDIIIEVTAQDGRTRMTYRLQVTNEKLVVKDKNADLSSLVVRDGEMNPRFKAGITDYEVAVKDDTSFIDILPVVAGSGATVRVYSESKELGDHYGNYSDSLREGENLFTIEVTAQDDQYSKEYNLTVYRKDEEKRGNLQPITADMIDFNQPDIILVDISRYPVVSADVFNTLKEKYPEKIINFQGNDYSLQMRGKDMKTLVPYADVYDLSISFSSPFEEDIWDCIYRNNNRYDGELVFVHFKHHGQLPGPMVFSLSLGRQYANKYPTWNYYNQERDRIDYYGTVNTNARGTLMLKLTHMSTYPLSFDGAIPGAEVKTESPLLPDWKPNPNTGAIA